VGQSLHKLHRAVITPTNAAATPTSSTALTLDDTKTDITSMPRISPSNGNILLFHFSWMVCHMVDNVMISLVSQMAHLFVHPIGVL
jgi:hypothetical protein